MSEKSKSLMIGYFQIKDLLFSANDHLLPTNERILSANDRILSAKDRLLSVKVVYFRTIVYFRWSYILLFYDRIFYHLQNCTNLCHFRLWKRHVKKIEKHQLKKNVYSPYFSYQPSYVYSFQPFFILWDVIRLVFFTFLENLIILELHFWQWEVLCPGYIILFTAKHNQKLFIW